MWHAPSHLRVERDGLAVAATALPAEPPAGCRAVGFAVGENLHLSASGYPRTSTSAASMHAFSLTCIGLGSLDKLGVTRRTEFGRTSVSCAPVARQSSSFLGGSERTRADEWRRGLSSRNRTIHRDSNVIEHLLEVERTGIEPVTSGLQSRVDRVRRSPSASGGGPSRLTGWRREVPLLRGFSSALGLPMPLPTAALPASETPETAWIVMARAGLEPATPRFSAECSTS